MPAPDHRTTHFSVWDDKLALVDSNGMAIVDVHLVVASWYLAMSWRRCQAGASWSTSC